MAFHIRDPETDRLVRELAAKEGLGITEAVKLAARERLKVDRKAEMWKALKEIQAEIARYPNTGLEADKAFYDSLNDE